MRRRTAWLSSTEFAVVSPAALAHDGGVVATITLPVIGPSILGIVGGTLSGWFHRRLAACIGGTLMACCAGIVSIELMTDSAVAKNFWPNIAFLASFAGIPLMVAYFIAHVVGRSLRAAKNARQEAPNSTAEECVHFCARD